MLPNACCCPTTCLIDWDDFGRANNTNIGGKWTETVGNSSISNNELSGLGSYTVITTKSHTSEAMVVQASLRPSNSSLVTESLSIIVNYLDSSNYLYVQFDFVYSGLGTPTRTDMKFIRRSGGVNTQQGSTRTLDAADVVLNMNARVCYDGTYLRAMGHIQAAAKIVGGFKAGLMYAGSLTTRFDDFYWWRYATNCPNCNTPVKCDSKCEPTKLPPSQINIDLGAGGLVDGTCSACDTIIGDYILGRSPTTLARAGGFIRQECQTQCGYVYEQCGMCSVAFFPPLRSRLLITACVVDDNTSGTFWEVIVDFRSTVGTDGVNPQGIAWSCVPTPGYFYQAIYRGSMAVRHDCDETPITLSRVSSQHGNLMSAFCTGNLPASVSLRTVA